MKRRYPTFTWKQRILDNPELDKNNANDNDIFVDIEEVYDNNNGNKNDHN